MSSSPFDDADEADVADQQRPAIDTDDDEPPPLPTKLPDEADEADVLEQVTVVGEDDDDFDR
ncbi:MAG TPA: hypothetical protein VFV89_08760 [Nocardioides sp.]|uniref:hypothetical protein n=1 Tax=Nocardioides sp. TaxID=35761 RepID=UPI002E2FCCD6|nr:hypothetical protein [Nocardioides sp.]HEX5087886.1 hypothetical protein [Nocardioides sp.]